MNVYSFSLRIIKETDSNRRLSISKSIVSNLPKESCSLVSPVKPQVWFNEWKNVMNEIIPSQTEFPIPTTKTISKGIYTDIRSLFKTDFDGKYHLVNTEEEADIIWSASHLKDYSSFQKSQLISQFPNEWLLTTKIGLMETAKRCRSENEQHPVWFPPTYDLRSEISNFMAHYEGRNLILPFCTLKCSFRNQIKKSGKLLDHKSLEFSTWNIN
jgi:hypothetical protein